MASTAKHDWPMVPFSESVDDVTRGLKKVQKSAYEEVGSTPIVDQSMDFICGYTDEIPTLVSPPYIVFGDHTRELKYLDFAFVPGADGVKVLKPAEGIDPKFLYYYLKAHPVQDLGYSRHFKLLKELTIPLPPLEEQRCIAAILDEVEDRVSITRSAVHRLDHLLESEFRRRFVAQECSIARLGDLAVWKSGGTPSRSARDYFDGEIPWFTSGELDSAYVSESKECITDLAISESAAKLFGPGTLLVGMYDTAALKSSIATASGTCNQAVAFTSRWLIEPDPLFVYLAIQSIRPKVLLRRRGARQKNLNLSIIREIEIPFPDSSTRSAFTTFAERVLELSQKHLRRLQLLEELRKSLSTRAFQGEL